MKWLPWRKKKGIIALSLNPPTPRPGRHGIAIVACVKNEEAYIAEWLRFHRAVGIRHFILYDHGSTDETVAEIRRTLPPEAFTLLPWAGGVVASKLNRLIDWQVVAFAHAIQSYGGKYRYMAFIDADEFLLPRQGSTIEEALAATGGFPNVSLPWHMFGTSGHTTKPDAPVAMSYTMRSADPMSRLKHASNFKCIVDPCEVTQASVHSFQTRSYGNVSCNDAGRRAAGKDREQPGFYSNSFLQLNHYYSKSEEEFAAKLARGAIYTLTHQVITERMTTTIRNIQLSQVEDRAMVDFVGRHGIMLERGAG
ncbi:glycosyltransferase family 92 protein [Rhizobium sp. ARZ01]|uniref:glycosyltransferase family 92 protein n=1 Tax=Rhizobium sp. ARZ01 TaxID=2769313 RepID=UPI00177D40FD|nr:glycosyltransferase family 92 protein [Rhizobium sp. ARZ01]MBD9373543.1 glycosyltransferase family 92 protein [Rhizobium sp. ARZ01]